MKTSLKVQGVTQITLESRIIGRGEIIGGLDIVIIINNRRGWNNRGKVDGVEKIVSAVS